MSRFAAVYRVPTWARVLTGVAAMGTAAAMPALVGSGSPLQVWMVAAAGIFSASIAIFGRPDTLVPSAQEAA